MKSTHPFHLLLLSVCVFVMGMALAPPVNAAVPSTIGEQKIIVLMVNFLNNTSTPTKPVKEEDVQAREIDFEPFFAELLNAPGLDPNGSLPAWWQGWPAKTHVRRWIDDLGLS